MKKQRIGKWGAITVVFTVLVLWFFIHSAEPSEVLKVLGSIEKKELLFFMTLVISAQILRSLRWRLLLRGNGVEIGKKDAFFIYLAGQAASFLTPGKVGDIFRSYLLKKKHKHKIRTTHGSVFIERLSDFTFLFLISLYGFFVFTPVSLFPIFFIFLTLVFIFSLFLFPSFAEKTSQSFEKLISPVYKIPERWKKVASSLYKHTRKTAAAPEFYQSLIFTLPIYYIEFTRIHYSIVILGGEISKVALAFSASVAVLVGVSTFVPGGAGGFDLTFASLLGTFGVRPAVAASALVFERVFNMGFIILLGLLVLRSAHRKKK